MDHNPVFKLVLSNPLGGAVLGQRTECRVIIMPGSKVRGRERDAERAVNDSNTTLLTT